MMYDSDDDYFTSYKPYGLIYKLTLPRGKIYIGKQHRPLMLDLNNIEVWHMQRHL